MKFLITLAGVDCCCPLCNTLLLPTNPDEPTEDDVSEWDSGWLCRHVRILHFDRAGEHRFRSAELQAWWEHHADEGWEMPAGATAPDPEGWPGDAGSLNEEYVAMATRLAAERPEISHFLVAETDAGGGPAPAWIALLAFSADPWPDDQWEGK